jgi:AraC-like DNA-binding protein
VLVVGLMCWLAGRRIAIDRTELALPRPAQEDDALLWGPDLRLGSGRTEVEFERLAALAGDAGSAGPEDLPAQCAPGAGDPLSQPERPGGGGVPALACPPLWAVANANAMAERQRLSASTLRRQLEREGRLYQQIKDEVRRAMAFELLREGCLSIAEVAEQTGFQEPSAFHRAFKKWIGQSPVVIGPGSGWSRANPVEL